MDKIKTTSRKKYYTFEDHFKELIKDPEFRNAYLESQPEDEIVRKIIQARIQKGVNQVILAKKMKTGQSVISRLESGSANPTLKFLKRLANALDSRLEIKLVPK